MTAFSAFRNVKKVNLLRMSKSPGYVRFARAMDWAMAVASIPFTAWLFWRSWPHPDVWAWLSLALIPFSFAMAMFKWQDWLEGFIQRAFFRRA